MFSLANVKPKWACFFVFCNDNYNLDILVTQESNLTIELEPEALIQLQTSKFSLLIINLFYCNLDFGYLYANCGN